MKKTYLFLMLLFAALLNQAQSLYFPPATGSVWDTISPQSLNWCESKTDSLYAYLDANNTKAFILLKDGKIVLEKYFGTHTPTSLWQWASAGKTIVSFMAGVAQQENFLSIADTTSKYLGQQWTICTPEQEEKITVRHQLTMTTGLDDGVADPFCTVDSCLFYKADAGTRWAYHNGPYTLLDSVIESATGTTLNAYTTQKLKNPTGITGGFVSVGYNNTYFSNARSMARFGLLILNKGNWNGNQLMTDTAYFNQMVNTSQTLNEAYGYLWWLNGKSTYRVPGTQFVFDGFMNPNAPADMFAAMGKDGQLLNIVPSQNLVWVRMGEAPDDLPVPFLMNDKIWEHLNELECDVLKLNQSAGNDIHLFPNPSSDIINIKSGKIITEAHILNSQGRLIQTEKTGGAALSISIGALPAGLYFIKARMIDGDEWIQKWIKE